jgi:dihydroorotate dehydrogenase electron transfer subunit
MSVISQQGTTSLEPDASPLRPIEVALCRVVFNRPLAAAYWHLAVAAPDWVLTVKPGQFFQLLCPGQGQGSHLLRRPMSVYRIDRMHKCLEFLYKVVGKGTGGLAGMQAGDDLDLFGPLGRGFLLETGWRHVVLLGRGAGSATLAPVAEAAIERGMTATAVLSAARPEFAVSAEHLRAVGAEVVIVTDDDGSSEVERVEPLLRRIVAERGTGLIATCGSNRLTRLAQRLRRELGIAGQVALEQPMACGIGICWCCVRPFSVNGHIEFRRVCSEGPVFDLNEALP